MSEQPKTFKFNSALLSCFDAEQTDDVSLESALHSNHKSEDTYEVVDGNDDVQFQVIGDEPSFATHSLKVVNETIEATNNAPTRKIRNNIESGLSVQAQNGVNVHAQGNVYEGYSIAFCNDMMPPFKHDHYETIQELANAMRELADLRTWRKFDNEQ